MTASEAARDPAGMMVESSGPRSRNDSVNSSGSSELEPTAPVSHTNIGKMGWFEIYENTNARQLSDYVCSVGEGN